MRNGPSYDEGRLAKKPVGAPSGGYFGTAVKGAGKIAPYVIARFYRFPSPRAMYFYPIRSVFEQSSRPARTNGMVINAGSRNVVSHRCPYRSMCKTTANRRRRQLTIIARMGLKRRKSCMARTGQMLGELARDVLGAPSFLNLPDGRIRIARLPSDGAGNTDVVPT